MPFIKISIKDIAVGDRLSVSYGTIPTRVTRVVTSIGKKYIYFKQIVNLDLCNVELEMKEEKKVTANKNIYKYVDYVNKPRESV